MSQPVTIYTQAVDKIIQGESLKNVVSETVSLKRGGAEVINTDNIDEGRDLSFEALEAQYEDVATEAQKALITINSVKQGQMVRPSETVLAANSIQKLLEKFTEADLADTKLPKEFIEVCATASGYLTLRESEVSDNHLQLDIHEKFVAAVKANPKKIKSEITELLGDLRLERAAVMAEHIMLLDKELPLMDLTVEDARELLDDRKRNLEKILKNGMKAKELFKQIQLDMPDDDRPEVIAVKRIINEGNTKNFYNKLLDNKTKLKVRVGGTTKEVSSRGTI
jgi:hypothetical protein